MTTADFGAQTDAPGLLGLNGERTEGATTSLIRGLSPPVVFQSVLLRVWGGRTHV